MPVVDADVTVQYPKEGLDCATVGTATFVIFLENFSWYFSWIFMGIQCRSSFGCSCAVCEGRRDSEFGQNPHRID